MPGNAEQWKAGGDCSMCRRVKYCKTDCREHKAFRIRAIRMILAQSKSGKLLNAMKHQLRDANNGKTEYLDG